MRFTSLRSLVRNASLWETGFAGRTALAAATALAVLVLALPSPAAYPPSAEGTVMAAATDNAEATRAALDVLAAGGNAVDGAIAAALALGVVNPSASGIGGGGFALVYMAKEKRVTALDFRETAPETYASSVLWPESKASPRPAPVPAAAADAPAASAAPVSASTTKAEPQKPRARGGAVGVPGEPAGLELLSRRFGKKALGDVAAPAITLAQRGFLVGHHTTDMVRMFKDRVEAMPTFGPAFAPGGVPAAYATRVRRPELATTLARFAAHGRTSIYEGETAQKIVHAVRSAGGTMTREDLASYKVKERVPLQRTVDGRTIYTMPAPSAGGLMLLETLSMYGASPQSSLATMGFGSSGYLHVVAEAMRGAVADRARHAGDPDLDPRVDPAFQAALDPAQLAARRARIAPNKTHAPVEFKTREQGTSHLVVTDDEGNVVSLTTTVNGPFGSGVVAGDTGILLNDELEDFTAPEDIKPFNLEGGGPNRPRPKARPVSSMTPTIVFEHGAPILAVGGSGGQRIATATTQAALARLVFGMDPTACVSAPRVHVQGADLLVDREIPLDVRDGLTARGESVREEPFQGSAVQMVAWTRGPNGAPRILAASDPRKSGFAAAR